MTSTRWWLLSLGLSLMAILLTIAMLTRDARLIGLVNARLSETSEFSFEASSAVWSIRSPLELSFSGAKLVHSARPEHAFVLDSLQFWFALPMRPASPVTLSRLAFSARSVPAQVLLSYLGAPFEISSSLAVVGDFSLGGSARGSVQIEGGAGVLDTRALERINRGPVRWARDSGHFVDWPEVMPFQSLSAEFDATRGFEASRFELAFENLHLTGGGALDLVGERMDYDFELRVSAQDDGAGFSAGELVADVPWPIRCQGAFADRLPCELNYQALRNLALRLIERDAEDAFSRTFGEVGQRLSDEL